MKAEAEIRSHLEKGLKYHQAAKKVDEDSPISFTTLRFLAYRIAITEGYFTGTNLQHRLTTPHGNLLTKCKKRLRNRGYTMLSKQNEIRKFMESKGSKGSPDLVATKDEVLLVEIIERKKASATFVDQLERYWNVNYSSAYKHSKCEAMGNPTVDMTSLKFVLIYFVRGGFDESGNGYWPSRYGRVHEGNACFSHLC